MAERLDTEISLDAKQFQLTFEGILKQMERVEAATETVSTSVDRMGESMSRSFMRRPSSRGTLRQDSLS